MDGHQLLRMVVEEAQPVFLVAKSRLQTSWKLKSHKRAVTAVVSDLEIRKSPCRSSLGFPKCKTLEEPFIFTLT